MDNLETAFETLKRFLDGVPLASVTAVVGIVMVIYAYFTGTITIDEAFKYFGYTTVGSGALGVMRSYSGKGLL